MRSYTAAFRVLIDQILIELDCKRISKHRGRFEVKDA